MGYINQMANSLCIILMVGEVGPRNEKKTNTSHFDLFGFDHWTAFYAMNTLMLKFSLFNCLFIRMSALENLALLAGMMSKQGRSRKL